MFIGVIALGCVFVLMVMVVAYLFRSRWLHHAEIKARQTCSAELCTKLAGLDELVMRSMMTDLHKSFPPLEEVRHAFTNIGCGIESCFTPESLDQVILLVLRGFDQDFVFQGAESPAATDGIQLDVASIPSAVTLRRSLGGAAVLDSYVTAQVSCLLRHVDTILQNCATSLATADGNEDELPSSACRRVCCLCGADEAYYAHTQNAFAENFARVGTSEATLRHCESAGFFGGGAAGGAPQPAADAQPPVALPIRDCHFAWEEKVEYDVIFAGSDGLRNRVAARLDVLRVAYWKSMSTKKLAYTMFEGLVVADRHAKIWHRAVIEWVYGMFLKVWQRRVAERMEQVVALFEPRLLADAKNCKSPSTAAVKEHEDGELKRVVKENLVRIYDKYKKIFTESEEVPETNKRDCCEHCIPDLPAIRREVAAGEKRLLDVMVEDFGTGVMASLATPVDREYAISNIASARAAAIDVLYPPNEVSSTQSVSEEAATRAITYLKEDGEPPPTRQEYVARALQPPTVRSIVSSVRQDWRLLSLRLTTLPEAPPRNWRVPASVPRIWPSRCCPSLPKA